MMEDADGAREPTDRLSSRAMLFVVASLVHVPRGGVETASVIEAPVSNQQVTHGIGRVNLRHHARCGFLAREEHPRRTDFVGHRLPQRGGRTLSHTLCLKCTWQRFWAHAGTIPSSTASRRDGTSFLRVDERELRRR